MATGIIAQCNTLLDDKDNMISLCSQEDAHLGSRVSFLYGEIERLLPQYYGDVLNAGLEAANALKAHKTVKVDPYIAGGAAQGIGGIGAGIVGATTAAQRNKQIDEWRKDSLQKSNHAQYQLRSSEDKISPLIEELTELLNSSKNVQDYRKNKTYLSGEQALSSQQYLAALSCFESTRGYKNTENYINEISEWWEKAKIKDIVKICISVLITSAVILLSIISYNNSLVLHTAVNDFRSTLGLTNTDFLASSILGITACRAISITIASTTITASNSTKVKPFLFVYFIFSHTSLLSMIQ